MANTKITELTAVTALAGTDVFPVVDVSASTTNKVSVEDLLRNAPDGTAGAPSIANADDQDTGILFPADNSVGVSTGGTQRLVIDSSGRIGIGTTSPTVLLDLESTSPIIKLTDSDASGTPECQISGAGGDLVLEADRDNEKSDSLIRFFVDGSERLRIDSSGNVGIGTSTITEKLEVAGDIRVQNAVKFRADDGAENAAVKLLDDDEFAIESFGSSGVVTVSTGSSNSERLRIDSSGNVGIGTTSASRLLELKSSAPIIRLTESTNTFSEISANSSVLSLKADEGNGASSTRIDLRVDGSEKMRIDSAGNVGVGTSSPSTTFHVNGSGEQYISVTSSTSLNAGIQFGPTSDIDAGQIKYAIGDNSLRFRVNNSEALRINSSGNVGIGTTSPASILHTSGSSDQTVTIQTTTTGADSRINFRNSGGTDAGGIHYKFNGNHLTFLGGGSNTERMRIDSSGRLLVGTSSSPSAGAGQYAKLLSVGNTLSSTGDGRLALARGNTAANLSSGNGIGELLYTDNTGATFAAIGANVDGTPGTNDYPGRLVFSTTADGASSPTERLRIDSSGNVGIGDSSPSYRLDVKQTSAGTVAALTGSTDGGRPLKFTSADNGIFLGAQWTRDVASSGGIHAWAVDGSEKARIDSSGRLLVGTTSSFQMGRIGAIQVAGGTGAGANNAFISATRFGTTSGGGELTLAASYGSNGNHGLVPNGHQLGLIGFVGSDGTAGKYAALIKCEVDGTSGTNDMPGRLVFMTTADGASSPTERMRINSSGTVLIGGTGAIDSGVSLSLQAASSEDAAEIKVRTNGQNAIKFRNASNSTVGSITVNASTTAYNTSSDYRLKENVVDLDSAITRVKQLQPRRFNFIADNTTTVDGFLAHEAQTVVPEAVTGTHNEVDDDGNAVMQGIDQSKLVPLLTAALQEAIAKIETLEIKVAALEAQ